MSHRNKLKRISRRNPTDVNLLEQEMP